MRDERNELDTKEGEAWCSLVDMIYAYAQVQLHELTKRRCYFHIAGGKSTITYRFITGFYCLTVMPTDFQKLMDFNLANINSVFVYIDDILLVTKGSKHEHLNKLKEALRIMDEVSLQPKPGKRTIAQESIEWLVYKITRTAIAPVNTKS